MISFIIITTVFLILYAKHYHEIGSILLISFALSLVFYLFFTLEHFISNVQYFISDEYKYYESDIILDNNTIDRFLWFGINYLIKNYDVFGTIGIKLINIPLLQIFIIYLWLIFNKDQKVLYISFVIPYLALIATKDFRDILIWLLTLLIIYNFTRSKIKALLYSVLLFFLRPLATVINLVVLIFVNYVFTIKLKRRLKKSTIYYAISGIFIFIIIVIITYKPVYKKMHSVYYAINYKIENGYFTKRNIELLKNDPYVTGDLMHDTKIGLIRYIFTPLPTSLLWRITNGGSEKWGIVDDIIRFTNQIFYFIILFYVILHPICIMKLFRESFNKSQRVLLYVLLLYWPLYSIHLLGITNQRQKLPFQIALFLIAISIYNIKGGKIKIKI